MRHIYVYRQWLLLTASLVPMFNKSAAACARYNLIYCDSSVSLAYQYQWRLQALMMEICRISFCLSWAAIPFFRDQDERTIFLAIYRNKQD